MGKGDKKTAKGKRVIGSYGNVRKRKSSTTAAVVTKTTKEKAEKPAAEKKPAAKKATVKKADLSKLTKDKLEAFAKENFKVDIDKRKKKADLVDEVFKLSKK